MQRNSLPTALVMLGWSYSCLSMVVSFHVKENPEISCAKGGTMYREWLALHQILADKLCIYIHAWNQYNLDCQSLGLWLLVHVLEKTVLSLAVTKISTKKV